MSCRYAGNYLNNLALEWDWGMLYVTLLCPHSFRCLVKVDSQSGKWVLLHRRISAKHSLLSRLRLA